MELIFLGTSAGTPTLRRNVSGAAIRRQHAKRWYLVDCGEGTQHRILKTPLSLYTLDAIFITHVHGDHCFGLPGLLASASMSGRTEPMRIYAPPAIEQFIRVAIDTSQSWLSYEIEFIPITQAQQDLDCGDFTVDVTELSHRVPSFAYGFTEKPGQRKLNVKKLRADQVPAGPDWGLIHQGKDVTLADGRLLRSNEYLLPEPKRRKIIICGDNDTPDCLADSAKTAEVVVHEATYTEDVAQALKFDPQHSTAQAIAAFAEAAAVKNLVLTHFSSRFQQIGRGPRTMAEIEAEARACYSGHLHLANDLHRFRLDAEGRLERFIQPDTTTASEDAAS
ncbi:ribonuclease Z [Allohahella marinimesophila]|uniref:Ribonuclease Z n=1 Tax=Allohahella marinimesophila TaxID=1054972 RepID=A0ABP7NFR3_9GAMM